PPISRLSPYTTLFRSPRSSDQGGGQYQSGVCVSSHAASGGHSQSWAQWIRWLPIRRGSPSGSPEPCAQHVHGLQGNSYWISSCLILSRVEASTKPGAIHTPKAM